MLLVSAIRVRTSSGKSLGWGEVNLIRIRSDHYLGQDHFNNACFLQAHSRSWHQFFLTMSYCPRTFALSSAHQIMYLAVPERLNELSLRVQREEVA